MSIDEINGAEQTVWFGAACRASCYRNTGTKGRTHVIQNTNFLTVLWRFKHRLESIQSILVIGQQQHCNARWWLRGLMPPCFFFSLHGSSDGKQWRIKSHVILKRPYGDNLCQYLTSGVQNPKWRTIIKELGVKMSEHISSLESTMQNSVWTKTAAGARFTSSVWSELFCFWSIIQCILLLLFFFNLFILAGTAS